VLEAEAAAELPPAGTQIMAGGKTVGQLATVQGRRGLAVARIDRVKDALDAGMPLLAAEVPLSLSIPAWAQFRFPEAAAGAEEG
jgi:folate-binding Fe-S cluster repair protein YgfZ